MDIIHAIRELCRGEHGFENMFDKTKSSGKLGQLTGGGVAKLCHCKRTGSSPRQLR